MTDQPTDLPEGWDTYDPNNNERTGQPEYEAARAKARERRQSPLDDPDFQGPLNDLLDEQDQS